MYRTLSTFTDEWWYFETKLKKKMTVLIDIAWLWDCLDPLNKGQEQIFNLILLCYALLHSSLYCFSRYNRNFPPLLALNETSRAPPFCCFLSEIQSSSISLSSGRDLKNRNAEKRFRSSVNWSAFKSVDSTRLTDILQIHQ